MSLKQEISKLQVCSQLQLSVIQQGLTQLSIAILRKTHSVRVRYTCNWHAYLQALQKAWSKAILSDTVLFVRELLRIRNNEIRVAEFTRPEIAVIIESVYFLWTHDMM